MAVLNPQQTTIGDLITAALKDAGALGIGQMPSAEDANDAWARLQWMLQQWAVARWMVYHLVTEVVTSTGQVTPYTVGPGGQFASVLPNGQPGVASRPNRIESAFFRQLINVPNGPVDWPLKLLPSFVDYNKIALKGLTTFSLVAFYDPAFPLGNLYLYPWPTANTYAVGITRREILPASFPSLATVIVLPFEYYLTIVSNLALLLRPKYGLGTFPGDMVPRVAAATLGAIKRGNTAIADLSMPPELYRNGLYNIFSDQNY